MYFDKSHILCNWQKSISKYFHCKLHSRNLLSKCYTSIPRPIGGTPVTAAYNLFDVCAGESESSVCMCVSVYGEMRHAVGQYQTDANEPNTLKDTKI